MMSRRDYDYLCLLLALGPVGVAYSYRNPTDNMPGWAIDLHHLVLERFKKNTGNHAGETPLDAEGGETG